MLISGEVPVKTYASMPSQTVGNGKELPFIRSTRDIKKWLMSCGRKIT